MVEKVKRFAGRSYGQFCGLARALDIVGDRWSLLIVRELLVSPMRFNELAVCLHGVATNLLTERLRTLESAGILERQLGEAGVCYVLTPWGQGLREPIEAFARWSIPLMISGRADDAFEPRWLAVALPGLLRNVKLDPPVELGFEVDDFLTVIEIAKDGPRVVPLSDAKPEVVFSAPAEVLAGLAAGMLTLDQALAIGRLQGDPAVLRRIFQPTRGISLDSFSQNSN